MRDENKGLEAGEERACAVMWLRLPEDLVAKEKQNDCRDTIQVDFLQSLPRYYLKFGHDLELSSTPQTLESWFRISLKAKMSVLCAFILFVLSCVQVVALRRTDPRPESHTDCVIRSKTEKAAKI
jgi:hypothetical protein